MALIVHPAGTQVSGSAGGTTYSHNRFGSYIRNRSIPVNPKTDRQLAVRNAVQNLAIAWNNSLTPAQRDGWSVYGDNVPVTNKLGQQVFLTGLNHFVRSNSPLLVNGFARVDDPPTTFTLAAAEEDLVPTASEATQQASLAYDDAAAWAAEDGAHQFFYGGLPKNAAVKFFGGPWRLMGTVDGDSVTPPTSPASLAWPFPFGAANRLWVRSRIVRADGRLSEFAQATFLAAV
jgi:hypothetical protein